MNRFCVRFGLAAAICAGTLVVGQTPQPPAEAPKPQAQTPAPAEPVAAAKPPAILERPAYVRRFSVGATGSYLVLDLMSPDPTEQSFTNPALTVRTDAQSKSKKYSFGGTLNFAVSERFAVNAMLLTKWVGYNLQSQFFVVQNASTVLSLSTNEETRARYWDLPIQIRRYNIGRHDQGWRWFYGIGPSVRYVTGISSSYQSTPTNGTTAYTTGAASPAARFTYGATGGVGLQFIDDFGIRFVPEVRYTRWFGATWDNLAAQSQRHQIEVIFSLTF